MPSRPPTLRAPWHKTAAQTKRERDRDYNRKRTGDPATALYKTARWRIERMHFLAEHPLCECDECQGGKLRITPADTVNHSIPHRGNEVIFWDRSKWEAMAHACHSRHTAAKDGGFGNPVLTRDTPRGGRFRS